MQGHDIETWLFAQMKGLDVKLCLFTVSVGFDIWKLAEHGQNAKNSMLSKYELGHQKMAELGKHTQKLWFVKAWAYTIYSIPLRIWGRLGPFCVTKILPCHRWFHTPFKFGGDRCPSCVSQILCNIHIITFCLQGIHREWPAWVFTRQSRCRCILEAETMASTRTLCRIL